MAQADQTIQAENEIKKYINHIVHQVKLTGDPAEKRLILDESLVTLQEALTRVHTFAALTGADQRNINSLVTDIREKQDELHGANGYSRVGDSELNDFSEFIQQDLEQANRTITISVTTALLAALILVLIAS
ncbi:MAG: hypothetical protein WDZ53_02500 [Balneolales bacterium]